MLGHAENILHCSNEGSRIWYISMSIVLAYYNAADNNIMIRTITNIEISSRCNNDCEYCPAPIQSKWRDTGLMEWDTFTRTIALVKELAQKGTQKELNLFGIGEPTLNPMLPDMIKHARLTLPAKVPLHFNTNGRLMTTKLARLVKASGIDHVDVTGHDPYSTARTLRIFKEVGIQGRVSVDFMLQPNNWAGQVKWFEPDYNYPCQWLRDSQVMVLHDGRVTTCCIDAKAGGVFAHVKDEDVLQAEPRVHALCSGCHHIVPENIAGGERMVNHAST